MERHWLNIESTTLEYSNPEIPEGINTTPVHPLKEFIVLAGGVLLLIAVAAIILVLLAEFIALRIPFEVEQELVRPYEARLQSDKQYRNIEDYLNQLAGKLARAQDLPDNMRIQVHYTDDATVNAMATLAGHIFIFRGLLEKLPNENALAMVLAHEVAHIKLRHPIMGLGKGVVIGLAASTVAGLSGRSLAGNVLGEAGLLTILNFTREQEHDADMAALEALYKRYGHIAGAEDLFIVFQRLPESKHTGPGFLMSHPQLDERMAHINALAKERGWTSNATTTPLPAVIKNILND